MGQCPRCHLNLLSGSQNALAKKNNVDSPDDILHCPKGDGVLLSLKQLEKRTNRYFLQHFWKYWRKLVRTKSIRCPSCASSMETLNEGMDSRLELDCCPNCFSLWLDTGEDEILHQFFISKYMPTRESATLEQKLSDEGFQVLAKAIMEHEATNLKYQRMAQVGDLLSQKISIFSRFRIFF